MDVHVGELDGFKAFASTFDWMAFRTITTGDGGLDVSLLFQLEAPSLLTLKFDEHLSSFSFDCSLMLCEVCLMRQWLQNKQMFCDG